jgi:hypothetical protein
MGANPPSSATDSKGSDMRFKRLTHLTAATAAALAFGVACDDNGVNDDPNRDDPANVDPLGPEDQGTDPGTGGTGGLGDG